MIGLETHLRAVRSRGRKLLIPYVTGGITADWTSYVLAYQAAGADAIEVGLPFSDPLLDGPTIQAASGLALARGATVARILADLSGISAQVTVPIVVMACANLVVRRGLEPFCAAIRAAGVSGLIVPDMPLNEIAPLAAVAAAAGLDLVLLAAPSTSTQRLGEICDRSRGFVYTVSVMGVTGERPALAASAAPLANTLKELTDRPVVIGFGVSSAAQAAEAASFADGVVVASALMRRVLDGATPQQVGDALAEMREGLNEHARV